MTKEDILDPDEAFIDEYLSHFGVVGMKWGVRRAANRKGPDRVIDAKIDINNRRIYRMKTRQSGVGYKASAAAGKLFIGSAKQRERQNLKIAELTANNKHLMKNGATTTKQAIGVYGNVTLQALGLGGLIPLRGPTLGGLVIQRTPKPLVKTRKK